MATRAGQSKDGLRSRFEILARERDFETVRAFLLDPPADQRALVIEGEPGIGKTVLWAAGVELAETVGPVFATRASEAESRLAYASLSDLLEGVAEEVFAALPAPQRHAMNVALRREEPDADTPDLLTVSLALLGVLRLLSERGQIVIAVDDLQWLAPSTARVLEFALRRLDKEPVRLFATLRVESGSPSSAEFLLSDPPADRLRLGAVSVLGISRILRDGLGLSVSRPLAGRIHTISGGNPFFALELGRAIGRGELDLSTDTPSAVPSTLKALVRGRLAALSDRALEVLLVAASARRPTVSLVEAVVGDPDRVARGLSEAERAGVVVVPADTIAFTHPLLASAIYAGTTATHRRALHRRLAEVTLDPDDAAMHLALATLVPEALVATAIAASADRARGRGTPDEAAIRYEHARRLTPPTDGDRIHHLGIAAANAHFASGDLARARALLEQIADQGPGGRPRAQALDRLAAVLMTIGNEALAIESLERALQHVDGDRALEGRIEINLASLHDWHGEPVTADEHAAAALAAAEEVDDAELLGRVLANRAVVQFQRGRAGWAEAIRRAARIQAAEGMESGDAVLDEGTLMLWSDDLDGARRRFLTLLERAAEVGDERAAIEVLARLSVVEHRAGAWDAAERYASESHDRAVLAGIDVGFSRRLQALVAACRGNVGLARDVVREQLPEMREHRQYWHCARLLGMLGFVELSVGNAAAAADALVEALEVAERIGVVEPGIFRLHADAVEALMLVGRLADAESVLARFEETGQEVGRRWAMATAGRCRAVLDASRGMDAAAVAALDEAFTWHEGLTEPLELGRTHFVAGGIHRRARRRRQSRHHLEMAIAIFERLGASLWLERARADLPRIDGRAPETDALTPTEARVAELIAGGHSNREIAEHLFITVRTVESNLTRIYQKLDVRSRTQLMRRMAEGEPAPSP